MSIGYEAAIAEIIPRANGRIEVKLRDVTRAVTGQANANVDSVEVVLRTTTMEKAFDISVSLVVAAAVNGFKVKFRMSDAHPDDVEYLHLCTP